jgi:Family of unknown function (DUF6714)
MTTDRLARLIREAFAETPYPGDQALVRSPGDEPAEVEALFHGRDDWRVIPPDLLDRAGAASPSALSFFSAAAFRFYLPAYLTAHVAGQLAYTDPLFYLYFGLDDATRTRPVQVASGQRETWWEVQQTHFAGFTTTEAAAIVAYLRWQLDRGSLAEFEQRSVREALHNYWLERAGEPTP